MLAFNHTLAGSIVGVIVPAPLVPVVALASHFVLDLFPHFGDHPIIKPYTRAFKWSLVIDFVLCVLGFGFAIWIHPDKWFVIGVGAFFGAVPDTFWLLQGRAGRHFDRFLQWAHDIQWGERPYGWIFDGFYAMLMVIAIYLIS